MTMEEKRGKAGPRKRRPPGPKVGRLSTDFLAKPWASFGFQNWGHFWYPVLGPAILNMQRWSQNWVPKVTPVLVPVLRVFLRKMVSFLRKTLGDLGPAWRWSLGSVFRPQIWCYMAAPVLSPPFLNQQRRPQKLTPCPLRTRCVPGCVLRCVLLCAPRCVLRRVLRCVACSVACSAFDDLS